jgi:S-layer homology domain
MHASRRLTRRWGLAAVCLMLSVLTGCQNTGLGISVESAIAPKSAEAIANKSLSQALPELIPVYRPANLQDLVRSPQIDPQNVAARWSSQDRSSQVVQFYRDRFAQNNWRTLQSPTEGDRGIFLAQNSDLLVIVSVEPGVDRTNILLQYVKAPQLLGNSPLTNPNSISASPSTEANPEANPGIFNNHGGQSSQPSVDSSEPFAGKFSDFDIIPAPLRPFIQDLSSLGILKPMQGSQFEPNATVTRRQYAAWLVAANNRIYSDNPSRQIRLSPPTNDSPIFTDVARTDPDFSIIQGLVNTGLIGAGNAGKANNLFKPDAPLTREDLVLWKVPLDLRRPLPNATAEAVKQVWGFQDSDRISALALRAVLADFSAGDLSNIRRSFGYTTIFQPQKSVTRAEAAAALWYFGTSTDGLSAQRVVQLERSNKPEPQSSDRATTSPSPQPSPTNSPIPNSKPDI